jgi:hypothetical protein
VGGYQPYLSGRPVSWQFLRRENFIEDLEEEVGVFVPEYQGRPGHRPAALPPSRGRGSGIQSY